MRIVLIVLVALSSVFATASCQPARSRPMPSRVPDVVPDSLPNGYYDRANWIRGVDGVYLRDVILVSFRREATRRERQAAIDAVHGVVVGGKRIQGTDGYYVVRVPAGGSPDRLWEIVGQLRALPLTVDASVDYIEMIVRPI
jgi:hypothetical protein